jgi:chromatin remodeling complex protein RSC6
MPPKKSVKSEPTKVDAPAPVAEPVVVVVETPASGTEVAVPTETDGSYTTCVSQLTAMRQQLSGLIQTVRTLQKKSEKELKAVQKATNKRKSKNGNRAPSGFVKPTLISDQLADFLNRPKGSLVARTEVTREINAYIRANSLQDPANGRKINPDAKLKKLLLLKPTDELTYFNLQKYMSQHFQKKVVAPVPTA